MTKTEASCPNCGSVVEFTVRVSLVAVCRSCESIVARGDRRLEDHGKVSAIIQTNSVFHLGQTGRYHDHPFEVVGHLQYRHPSGGHWDEWYIAFPGDRWAWIAEAQGKRYFTRARKITSHMSIPSWEELSVGKNVSLSAEVQFQVREFGIAHLGGAEGELPFLATANAPHRFADLTGPNDGFASLTYGDAKTELFLGHQIRLKEVGISEETVRRNLQNAPDPSIHEAIGLNCPQCGGTLELRAPDQSQRVTCHYCSSLLDVEKGSKLMFLSTLNPEIVPLLPLGTEGEFFGTKYTVIGFVRRAVLFDAEYFWDEFLLYEPSAGFRWLVHSDRHWSFVEPVDDLKATTTSVTYRGDRYRLFQRAWATVLHVYGEFYWKVSVGDIVLAVDFIAPPKMITVEMTPAKQVPAGLIGDESWSIYNYSESVYSLGTYIEHSEVEKAFKLPALPRGAAIAPNQPAPNYLPIFIAWPLFVLMLIAIDLYHTFVAQQATVHAWTVVSVLLLSLYPVAMIFHRYAFEKSRWADSQFNPYSSDS